MGYHSRQRTQYPCRELRMAKEETAVFCRVVSLCSKAQRYSAILIDQCFVQPSSQEIPCAEEGNKYRDPQPGTTQRERDLETLRPNGRSPSNSPHSPKNPPEEEQKKNTYDGLHRTFMCFRLVILGKVVCLSHFFPFVSCFVFLVSQDFVFVLGFCLYFGEEKEYD